jgi:diaminohydroxyphosphoribosylaminopyrimidine deaminase/5-amino-6-(5-phosphoribosylamino)uracil reductase
LKAHGCETIEATTLSDFLQELGRRGMTNVLVEGGSHVLGSFFDAGLIDEVDIFIAPKIDGGSHDFTPVRGLGVTQMADALRLKNQRISILDGDVRVQGEIDQRVTS